jgi:hypothetical protein
VTLAGSGRVLTAKIYPSTRTVSRAPVCLQLRD